MTTVTFKNDDNTEKQRSREEFMQMYDSIYKNKHYGHLDYPFSVYNIIMSRSYLNYIHWHWHDEMEVIVVNEGTAEVATDEETLILTAGQGVLINQNVMHSVRPIDGNDCSLHSVVFHPDYIFSQKGTYLRTRYLLPLNTLHPFRLIPLSPDDPCHAQMLEAICSAVSYHISKPFGYEIAVLGQLCQFWFLLIERMPKPEEIPAPRTSLDEQRVKQAMLFIRTHYAEPLTLSDIADSVHISKSECCRCFARTLQLTPFEYLMKYRIFEATRILLNNPGCDVSISDLSIRVGFNNTSYFNKVFKRYLGCTPTYYRTHHASAAVEESNALVPALLSDDKTQSVP